MCGNFFRNINPKVVKFLNANKFPNANNPTSNSPGISNGTVRNLRKFGYTSRRNSGKCCSIQPWKFPKMETGSFGLMKKALSLSLFGVYKENLFVSYFQANYWRERNRSNIL